MLTELAPLGVKNIIHIIAAYDGPNVTITVSITPKDKTSEAKKRTLQLSGPISEVEAGLAATLTQTAESVAKFQTTLDELEAANAADLAAAKKPVASKAPVKAAKAKADAVAEEEKKAENPPITTGGFSLDNLIAEANAKK